MIDQPPVELRLLGRFVALRDGAEIPAAEFGGRKVRALLRILATRRGSFVPNESLTEFLWGERPPADPAANLQVLVNRARRALDRPELVITGSGGYALAAGQGCVIDAEEFLLAAAATRQLHGRALLDAIEAALHRWGGEPLTEDRYADWAGEYRQRLLRTRQFLLEEGAAAALQLADARRALELSSAAVAAEPLREAAVLGLVRALDLSGDPAAALERYELYRRALAEELGVDPSSEAQAVQADLLRGAGRERRPAPALGDTELVELPFLGRARELATLRRAATHGARVLVTGPSGAGKSRLLEAFGAHTPLLTARAFLAERDEPWSLARSVFRELLAADADAAGELPASMRGALGWLVADADLGTEPAPLDPESRRALLVEAAARMLTAAARPFVVDDVQWADPTSLTLLESVLARAHGIGAVLALRPVHSDEHDAVSQFVRHLRSTSNVELIELGGFGAQDMQQLIVDQELVDALVSSTDGTPMAIVEVVRGLAAEGLITRSAGLRWRALRAEASKRAQDLALEGQRRAIAQRVAAQPRQARELLELLAVAAREVPARLLARALDADERRVLEELGQLAGDGLVRLGERGWAPAHDMIGETVANGLEPDARGPLHGLLAQALAALGGDPGELAAHWLGAGDAGLAAAAYLKAAQRALDGLADTEAISLATAGLDLEPPTETAAALQEIRAEARGRRGDIVGARTDLRAALSAELSGPARSRLLGKLAMLTFGADDLVRAGELAEVALVEAGSDRPARARALEIAALLDMNLDRRERADARAGDALSLYQELGDAKGAARVLDARAMATFLAGDVAGGTALLERAANLFEDSGDLVRVMTPRSTAGHGLVFAGDPAAGLTRTASALELARTLGHPEGQTYALWHTAEALAALDRHEEARAAGEEALEIAQRIGHRGWTATAWRAIGIARQGAGDLDAALLAFQQSLDNSANLGLFASWAASRCALVMLALGRVDDAAAFVERALSEGPPLGHFEARWAEAELAAARGDSHAAELARSAVQLAEGAGVKQAVDRLTLLAD